MRGERSFVQRTHEKRCEKLVTGSVFGLSELLRRTLPDVIVTVCILFGSTLKIFISEICY